MQGISTHRRVESAAIAVIFSTWPKNQAVGILKWSGIETACVPYHLHSCYIHHTLLFKVFYLLCCIASCQLHLLLLHLLCQLVEEYDSTGVIPLGYLAHLLGNFSDVASDAPEEGKN